MGTSARIWNFLCGLISRGPGFPSLVDSIWRLWLLSNFYPAQTGRFTRRADVQCAKSQCAANGFRSPDLQSATRIDVRRLRFVLIETRCLQLGEDSADKNLRFNAERDAVGIIRNPHGRAPEFSMRLQFKFLAHALDLNIDFDCVVGAGANVHPFAAEDGDRC